MATYRMFRLTRARSARALRARRLTVRRFANAPHFICKTTLSGAAGANRYEIPMTKPSPRL